MIFVATSPEEWVAKSMDRLIDRSAWNRISANFAFLEFCELRLIRWSRTACELRRHSPNEHHHNGDYERVRKRGRYRPPELRVAFSLHVGHVGRVAANPCCSPYSREFVEGEFCELRRDGVLRSSLSASNA